MTYALQLQINITLIYPLVVLKVCESLSSDTNLQCPDLAGTETLLQLIYAG